MRLIVCSSFKHLTLLDYFILVYLLLGIGFIGGESLWWRGDQSVHLYLWSLAYPLLYMYPPDVRHTWNSPVSFAKTPVFPVVQVFWKTNLPYFPSPLGKIIIQILGWVPIQCCSCLGFPPPPKGMAEDRCISLTRATINWTINEKMLESKLYCPTRLKPSY